jgi:tetratricopeptide (TPR) repeat protein
MMRLRPHHLLWLTALFVGSPAQGTGVDAPPTEADDQALFVRGQRAMAAGDQATAIDAFEEALAAYPNSPTVRLHLAHAYVQSERYTDGLRILDDAPTLADTHVAHALIRARALRALGHVEQAHAQLERAAATFPNTSAPALEMVVLLKDMGLLNEARTHAWRMSEGELDRATTLALMHVFYQDEASLPLLEALLARHPEDPTSLVHAAHAYAASHHPNAAARLFAKANTLGAESAFEAADQYRIAGQTERALTLNALVSDAKRRVPQRIATLFAAGAMARVTQLERSLDPSSNVDTRTRYRLAFAHYRLGQFAQATEHARELLGGPLDSSAVALLRAMGRDPLAARPTSADHEGAP